MGGTDSRGGSVVESPRGKKKKLKSGKRIMGRGDRTPSRLYQK